MSNRSRSSDMCLLQNVAGAALRPDTRRMLMGHLSKLMSVK